MPSVKFQDSDVLGSRVVCPETGEISRPTLSFVIELPSRRVLAWRLNGHGDGSMEPQPICKHHPTAKGVAERFANCVFFQFDRMTLEREPVPLQDFVDGFRRWLETYNRSLPTSACQADAR